MSRSTARIIFLDIFHPLIPRFPSSRLPLAVNPILKLSVKIVRPETSVGSCQQAPRTMICLAVKKLEYKGNIH